MNNIKEKNNLTVFYTQDSLLTTKHKPAMNKYKELKVWQRSVDLATNVYQLTKHFRSDERFGLTSQINRSVVSIASNIAEGSGRGSKKDFSRFLSIAYGSAYELETQIIISNNLKYLSVKNFKSITECIDEVQKMLFGLQKSLSTEN
jgi:four helix bundle protein